ncbi:MAG TPA: nitric-oxide reductase [Planctomycetes bacterium]|nr:nitric-oxide reductase [Planctomycetota bacterium]
MNSKHLWIPILLVMVFGATGVLWMGARTYQGAPPIPTYVSAEGKTLADREEILDGQLLFQQKALMQYGTMFGDGGARGPDFTARALHVMATSMRDFYRDQASRQKKAPLSVDEEAAIQARVQRELKQNNYDPKTGEVRLSEGQSHAFEAVQKDTQAMLNGDGLESIQPKGLLSDPGDLHKIASFFFWGGWVCSVRRPGESASYTHNWPYDPQAGNTPGTAILLWSVIGAMALILGLGITLMIYGRFQKTAGWHASNKEEVATPERIQGTKPTPTQRATFKFFAVAASLFLVQVLAGIWTIHDFVGFTTLFGLDLQKLIPLTISRSWHIQVSILWIATCWIGASIFCLPRIAGKEPSHQLTLVNTLFWMLVVVVAGTLFGSLLGPKGFLGDYWRMLGNQGWEFVELGKLFQGLLFLALVLWVVIVFRGVRSAFPKGNHFSLPHWLFYTTLAIAALFLSSFVAGPRTNFVIADFWRWMVIHMWAECFFEVFTTVIVAYFLVVMGLVSKKTARFTVYLAVILFWGTGFLGIAHNFYWNAKPSETLALGSVFSTMQVIPLILLSYEAWRFRRMPMEALKKNGDKPKLQNFGLSEAFLFLIAVNFWNFFGAGVFGFIINLPIVNYYEHGTYLTVNHGHAALMGVYGNLSIAGILFCSRYLIRTKYWNPNLLRVSFWSLNIGLMLMVLLDTLPAGLAQLVTVLDSGMWAARSQEFIQGATFQTLTLLRMVGGALFTLGGVLPLVWFMNSNWTHLKQAAPWAETSPETEEVLGGLAPTPLQHPED